jgi:hypothetical protein
LSAQDKSSEFNWLSTEENPYGSEEFGDVLAGKLGTLTSDNIGPGAYLHYNNVSIAYTHVHGLDIEGVGANAALVTRSGDQGSVAELRIPAAAGLLHKAWNIVVGPEVTWSSQATTTDFASEAQAVTTRNALQYYWELEGVGSRAKAAAFEALAFAEGGMHVPWDRSAGEDVGIEPIVGDDGQPQLDANGQPRERLVKTGDIAYRRVSTWDIIRDPSAPSFEALEWVIIREWPNKFDVASSCDTEDKRQACISSSIAQLPLQGWLPFRATHTQQTDRIPVYYLYHNRTASVPGGRQTVFLQDGTVLEDGPLDEAYVNLPPECIGPFVRMAAGEYSGTPWPYSKYFATLGAGQATDALDKDLLTNATAVSGPVVSIEDDAIDSVPTTQMGGGPRVIPRPKGSQPPVVLDMKASSPDHFKLHGLFRNEQQQILGIDNITAGQEVGANLSGAAMALMTSTSVQNNSQWQAVWVKFVQAIGNVTLRHIQKHMDVPKKIALAGNARASLVTTTEVSSQSVSGIERVFCSIGSPLQQTDAGKYEIATTALKEGWAQTPEQFQTVMDTGRLDALTQDLSNELLLINSENEALGRAEDAPVMLDDNHVLHLKLHRAVTASLTARRDPRVVQALQLHQDAHIRVLRETDPAILQLFGQPSMAPNQAGGAPPQAPGGPGGPGAPQEMAQAAGPSLPKNPQTGEPAGPVAGQKPPALAVKA